MNKRLIQFRKKYIMPYFWYLTKRKEISLTKTRDIEEILDKRDAIKEELLKVERADATVLIKVEEAKLELINWIIQKYGESTTKEHG